MAILGAEGTIARMVIPGTTAFLILHYGWRGLFTTIGVVVLAVTPLLFLFLEEPGTRGLKPTLTFKRPAAAAPAPGATVMAFEGFSFKQAMRDKVFWLMLIAALLAITTGGGMLNNITASLIDRGFRLQTIGNIDSAAIIAGIPGVLIAGYLMDKIHSPKVAVPFHLLTALAAFLYMTVTPTHGGQPMLLIARCMFNFAFTASLPISAYLMTRFFGLKAYATIYGFMAGIPAFGAAVAPVVFARIYDVTHSYRIGYEAWVAAAAGAALIYLILPRYRFSANIGGMPAASKDLHDPPGEPASGGPAIAAAE
jgi:sugar phosphate permease